MSIPHVDLPTDNGMSGHFTGIQLDPEGYWIEFSIREGLDGSDLIVLRQQIWDTDHELSLDQAVANARRDLIRHLELVIRDIRTGEVVNREGDLDDDDE